MSIKMISLFKTAILGAIIIIVILSQPYAISAEGSEETSDSHSIQSNNTPQHPIEEIQVTGQRSISNMRRN